MGAFMLIAPLAQAQQCIQGNCQNGFGVMSHSNGQRYMGQFANGKYNGLGYYSFPNGEYYYGEFKNDKYGGYGTYRYANGTVGRGFWNDVDRYQTITATSGCIDGDCNNGLGTYVFNNGDEYRGQFSNQQLNGHGLYVFANSQERYIGDFKNNKRQGQGAYYYKSGNVDFGQWANDNFVTDGYTGQSKSGCVSGDCSNGNGTYVFDNGSKYIGMFNNGELHGYGTYQLLDGSRYVGNFARGKYNGYGTYYYADGRVDQGNWVDNKFSGSVAKTGCNTGDCNDGIGTFVFENGNKYIGKFAAGQLQGYGTLFFTNGDKYEGQFMANKYEGKGKYTYKSGKIEDGLWSANNFLGENVAGKKNSLYEDLQLKQDQPANNNNQSSIGTKLKDRRLALVIGNGNYVNAGVLKNPVNDARAMSTALSEAGFDVIKVENGDRNEMIRAINTFGDRLKSYDVGLFFFAGHGLQVKGNNYVVPTTAAIGGENEVELECVEANRVLAKMESAGNRLNIVIMDACRNNPFERSWNRSTNGNGLASMSAPVGSFIAYATAPGSVASDGQGSNGLYTSQLLRFMRQPNLKLEDVFKQVRISVMQMSGNAQTPWESSSLMGDFYFSK
jgi:hypothetical protein